MWGSGTEGEQSEGIHERRERMRHLVVGMALMAVAPPSLALLGSEFAMRWFSDDTLYTAEKQIVDLAMRNPPGKGIASRAEEFKNDLGRFTKCRVTSTARTLRIEPDFCELVGGKYPTVNAFLKSGTAISIPIVGRQGRSEILGQSVATGEGWLIMISDVLAETRELVAISRRSGMIALEANRPIRKSSASCPVVIQSAKTLYKRIDGIESLLETERTGSRDAEADLAKGERKLYLSNQTVDRAACRLATVLASHKFKVIVQDPPPTHYHAAYIDNYNDVVWREAEWSIGDGFEKSVLAIVR